MVDIQSATAEIRRGKKKEETTGRKYNGLPYSIGRPQIVYDHLIEVAPSLQTVRTLALRLPVVPNFIQPEDTKNLAIIYTFV